MHEGNYPWGVNWDGSTTRDTSKTEIIVIAQPGSLGLVEENFTIAVEGGLSNQLVFSWDKTIVSLPFTH